MNITKSGGYIKISLLGHCFALNDHDCVIFMRIAQTPAHKEKQARIYNRFCENLNINDHELILVKRITMLHLFR